MSCNKVSPNGHKCEREANHKGSCFCHEGTTYIIFQPGWVNQGNTPARRELLTVLFCGACLFAVMGSFVVFADGIGRWLMLACCVLLVLTFAFIPNRFSEIWRNYKSEKASLGVKNNV